MPKRYHSSYEDRESFSPWESYSDLYCGLLLVFVLLFFFICYQYIDAREKNNAQTLALQESMREEQTSVLALYKAELENQEAVYQEKLQEVESQRTALAIVQADLESRTALLEEQEGVIGAQEEKLLEQEARLGGQEAQLAEQQALIQKQSEDLVAKQAALDSQAAQIEQIVGVRGRLIQELNAELEKNEIQVQADKQTGAIIFESSILFAKDSNVLSEDGKIFFQKFMPVYLGVIFQDKFRDYIAEIIVEGHTDNSGSYLHNLELSQQRAFSVTRYVIEDGPSFLGERMTEEFRSHVTANGCADKDPIYKKDGTVHPEKSRRVEIKFRLKDQEMIQEMDAILNP